MLCLFLTHGHSLMNFKCSSHVSSTAFFHFLKYQRAKFFLFVPQFVFVNSKFYESRKAESNFFLRTEKKNKRGWRDEEEFKI